MVLSIRDIVCCVSLLVTHLCPISPTTAPLEPSYLLPSHVAPYRYHIYLDVRFYPDFKYYGSEYIYVRIQVPTSEITLHVDRALVNISICNIEPATEFQPKQTGLDITQLIFSESEQRLTLKLNQILEKNENYRIYFEFSGFLNQKTTDSFYVLKYLQDRYVASTVFEPNLARNVFPCFDEPHYKSYFLLMLRRPHHMTALSNMPVEKTIVDGEYRVDHFQESLLMSPYLLCFAIGTFDSASLWNKATQYKVYVARNSSHDSESELRETRKSDDGIVTPFEKENVATEEMSSQYIEDKFIDVHTNKDNLVGNNNNTARIDVLKNTNSSAENDSPNTPNIAQNIKNNKMEEEFNTSRQPSPPYDSRNSTHTKNHQKSDIANSKHEENKEEVDVARSKQNNEEVSVSKSAKSSNVHPALNNIELYSNSISGVSTSMDAVSGGESSEPSTGNIPEGFVHYLNTSVRLIHFLERQLGVEYKLPKLDLLFLPGFRYEALENWGLVSINARYGITNSTDSSHQVLGTRVLAHELVHNWFGNLVSVRRWSEIWMSEGLANFYTVACLDHLEARWQFGLSQVARSMRLVMRLESQPRKALPLSLVWDGHAPQSLFNHAVYEKSFCVLRMLNYTLGEQIFTKSIQTYLRVYQFRSTTADDLLEIFDQTYNEHYLDKERIGRFDRNGLNTSNGFAITSKKSIEYKNNTDRLNGTEFQSNEINLHQAKTHNNNLDQQQGLFNLDKADKASSKYNETNITFQNNSSESRPGKHERKSRIQVALDNSPLQVTGVVGVSLKKKMQTWILNPGFPLVKVIRGYDSGQVFISQERFQKPGPHTPIDPTRWWIPLSWFSESEPQVSSLWFNPGEEMLALTTQTQPDEWIIFNHEFSGLYSVVYDARNYARLASYMNSPHNFSRIPPLNRIQLLSDLVLFTKYKILLEDILMEHLQYFQYETEPTVWATFSALFKDIRAIFNQSEFREDFQDLMVNVSPIRSDLNFWSFDKVQNKETHE